MRTACLLLCACLLACSSGDGKSVLMDLSGTVDGGGEIAAVLDLCGSDCPVGDVLTTELPPDIVPADLCVDGCPNDFTCAPDSARCEGNAWTRCLADGSGWTIAEPCDKTTSCLDGLCGPWPAGSCEAAHECMVLQSCEDADLDCIAQCLDGLSVGVSDYVKEIFWCVVTQCEDDWQPEGSCFQEQRLGLCKWLFDTCTGVCLPDCGKSDCGSDGCGGSCGVCVEGFSCDPNGKCLCQPDCEGKNCGPNGCGATCGVCTGRKPVCNEAQVCEPEPESPCGDGDCSILDDETCFSCPLDCGSCPECGDAVCDEVELCTFCPADCGPCDFGDCCAYHDSPGCEDAAIVQCVCNLESDCCLFPWSNDCVLLAADCGAGC